MFVGDNGAYKEARPFIGVGGAFKTVKEGFVGVGGAWKRFFVNFSASVTPTTLAGQRFGAGTVRTTSSATVAVEGPQNVSYSWERVFGSSDIQAGTPSLASTDFVTNVDSGQSKSAVYQCRVTDINTGDTVVTEHVDVSLESLG